MAEMDDQNTGPWSDYAAPAAAPQAASDGPWADYQKDDDTGEKLPASWGVPRFKAWDWMSKPDEKSRIAAHPVISTQALTPTRTPFDKPTYNPADAAVEQGQGPAYAMRPNAAAPQTVGYIAPAARAGATLTPTARAPLAQPAARTPVQMQTPQDRVDTGLANAQSYETEANAALGSKVTDAATSIPKDLYQGVQKTVGQTGEDFDRAKFVKGITQLVSGGSKAAIVLSAPELMELGFAADAGDVAAQANIIKLLGAAEAGNIGSDVGGVVSDKFHLSPETKDLIQTAAFFLPTLAGAMKFKGGGGVDAKGNPGIGFSSGKGGVRAGAVGTPEAYDIRAQVGDTRVGVRIPRSAPPDPAQILQAQQTDAGTSAIIRAATKQKQAATVVAGGPPPPPPGPKLPAAMQDGVISPQSVQDIATMIHLSPVEQHPKLIMEAHGKLAEYIQKQGRIIDPDGKLQIAETPQQAAKLAANIINNEVDRQSQAKEDAAKEQEQVAKEQEAAAKEANKPGEDGGLSPADQQWARAKTIIESTTLQPGQKIESVLQRNLRVGPGTANEMMQRYQTEKTQEALPTVGSKKEPVVEESRATVDAQIEAMKRGDTNVVMLPEGSKYRPKVPDGMKLMAVRGDSPGAGLYIYNPQAIRASTIKEAARAGSHGDLLGHLQPKSEIAAAPEKPTVVVQAQDKATGTPIQDSEVHPERVAEQTEAMKERHPDAKIVVKPTHEVLIDRLKAQQEDLVAGEGHPADDYAKPAETTPAKEVAKSKEKETLVSEKAKEPEAAAQTEEPVAAAPEKFAPADYQAVQDRIDAKEDQLEKAGHNVTRLYFTKRPGSEALHGAPGWSAMPADLEALYDERDGIGEGHLKQSIADISTRLEKVGIRGDEARRVMDYYAIDPKNTGGTGQYMAAEHAQEMAKQPLKEQVESMYIRLATERGIDIGTDDLRQGIFRDEKTKRDATAAVKTMVSYLHGLPSDSAQLPAPEPSKEVAKEEVAKPTKGTRVAFKDRDGIEREGVISHRSDRITRIGKYDVATSKVGEERPELKPGQIGRMAVSELHLDPKRFQYKVSVGANGVSDLLTGKKWNDNLAGVTSVWRDPADGKAYVVNGHHRATLAKQSKTGNLPVRMLEAKDATEARSIGALQNIAEGRGTALDAAKFLRDSGITLADLEEKGISMGEATAQNGVALSRLDARLFDMVVAGKMGQGRGVAIGRETGDPATQDAIVKLIDKAERRGQKVNDGTVEELARFAQTAPLRQETVASLFGTEDRTESTAIEKAEVSAFVKRQLSSEKRIFGAVSTEAKAKTLSAEGKNQIDAAGNAAKATSAEQALEVYDKLSARRGPIDDILNRAAEELSSGGAEVKQRAYEAIRAAVSDALGGSERASAGRHEETADGSPDRADLEAAGQGGFFSRRKPNPVDSFALPGFEGDIEKQSESAKETTAEEQRKDVEHSLTTAKGDISKAAGKMERESPLFFGSGANEQKTLFNVSRDAWAEASGRDWAENAASAIVKAIPASGNRHGMAELNASAYYVLRGITSLGQGSDFDGITLPQTPATEVLAEIRRAADSYESLGPTNASTSQSLREIERGLAAQVGTTGKLVLVRGGLDPKRRTKVVLEEQIHLAQMDHFGMTKKIFESMAELGDQYNGMVGALVSAGYKNLSATSSGMEVSAKLLARMYEDLGVDPSTGDNLRGKILGALDEKERNLLLSLEENGDAQGIEGGDLAQGIPGEAAEGGPLRGIHRTGERATTDLSEAGQRSRGRDEVDDTLPGRPGEAQRDNKGPESALQSSPEQPRGTTYLHGAVGFNPGSLKPLANIKPVADILAFLGDEADRVAVSRDLHNRLYDMASQDNAAVLRVVQMLQEMPGTAKDQQAIYHHLEDPKSVTLTKDQEAILDDYLTPLIYHAEHDFQVITEGGVPLDNYVHRQVRDRGGMIDRLIEKVKSGETPRGVGGGRLTKTAPAQKHRTMMALQDVKTGKRQVVSIKGGRVTAMRSGQNPEDLGGLRTGLTSVGEEVDKRMMPYVERVTELREEIAGAKDADKVEQLADIQPRIADLKKQRDVLDGVNTKSPGRKPDLFDKSTVFRSSEVTFNQRAEITKKLDPLLKREESLKNGTAPMLLKNVSKLKRRKEELLDAEAARDHFLNELPPETFSDKAWKDKNGGLHTITQATTKEIEANTNVRYYQNAAASVAVNYLAMDKARRAYEFLEDFKKSPEFAAASHSINSPGAIPKGWKATQLPQFRGYFFEPHIAEVLDAYAAKAAHDPSVLEKVGNFLRSSIFFNPLIHIPNLLNHWVVEKGVSGFANPLNYPKITRAGIKAINAVIHQNKDFLEALDHGAPLQSQQFETKQFADLFFKRMQEELGDPESSKAKELATALGMSPVNLIKAIYKFSGQATWYTNDIAFLQSTYEKQERGMSLKDALTETAKHIPDYRLMTRIFDNPKLAKLMSNRNLTMFGAYHYGALKSYGQMAKSLTGFNWTDAGTKNEAGEPTNAAGRTEGEEKLHGLDTLAMMALVTFVAYPLLDKLWRAFTGNDKAQMRRAGASTLIYNLAMLAKGEKTPVEVAESIATPAVQTKALAEMVLNRDLRTGQRLYDPHAPAKKLAGQVGRQLLRSVAPVSQGMDIAEGRTDVKRLMYSMVGVSFPLHGAEKIAAQITAERLSSLPPRDEDEIAHAIQRSRAIHDHWSGDNSKLIALLHGKDYTAKEKAKIRKDALLPPIVYAVRGMTYDDAVRVYHAADAHERHQLKSLMSKKLATLIHEGKKPANSILGKDDDN